MLAFSHNYLLVEMMYAFTAAGSVSVVAAVA